MVWKASIDLVRPLVETQGQHDPFDGLVTCLQMEATARVLGIAPRSSLHAAIADLSAMVDPEELVTSDPLGIGGLLTDACRLAQIGGDRVLVGATLAAAERGLASYLRDRPLGLPAPHRLAFRELGLAIGLAAEDLFDDLRLRDRVDLRGSAALARMTRHREVRPALQAFWLRAEHRETESWREHQDIDDVMLATTLCPGGFLRLDLPVVPTRGEASGDEVVAALPS
jgi:hypothetical protein